MNEPNKESNLVKLREKRDLTQKKIAETLGVTEQTVRNWEQGKAVPKLTIAQTKALCRLLNLSIEELPDSLGPSLTNQNADRGDDAIGMN